MRKLFNLSIAVVIALIAQRSYAQDQTAIDSALRRAGSNRGQIEKALREIPEDHAEGMRFLLAYMPDRDLQSVSAEFLSNNVKFAYQAWNDSPWKDKIPKEIFLNDVLPYASINERRDDWREDFMKRCQPLIQDAQSPGEAAALLNQKIFPLFKVKYSTQRRRADQGPYESIESGLASCTGLSLLLIDACRSQCIPARFVGTPLWSDKSGNHSWVEVWDDGWHFTGAAEPSGNDLDRAWFLGRASTADRNSPQHAIYATSWKQTPISFPLVWDPNIDYVPAINVTDRYTNRDEKLPEGHVRVMFQTRRSNGERLSARIKILDSAGASVFAGTTNDERFDANNHTTVALPLGQTFQLQLEHEGKQRTVEFEVNRAEQLLTIEWK